MGGACGADTKGGTLPGRSGGPLALVLVVVLAGVRVGPRAPGALPLPPPRLESAALEGGCNSTVAWASEAARAVGLRVPARPAADAGADAGTDADAVPTTPAPAAMLAMEGGAVHSGPPSALPSPPVCRLGTVGPRGSPKAAPTPAYSWATWGRGGGAVVTAGQGAERREYWRTQEMVHARHAMRTGTGAYTAHSGG